MTIRKRFQIPNLQAFRVDMARCGSVSDIAQLVQQSFAWDGIPGYSETSVGATGSCPLPDMCTVVLLQGSFQLDDENERVTDTFMAFDTEGSKTVMIGPESTVVWFPSVCCWDFSKCALARRGQCRRIPGVVIPRDPKNPAWWEKDDAQKKSRNCIIL